MGSWGDVLHPVCCTSFCSVWCGVAAVTHGGHSQACPPARCSQGSWHSLGECAGARGAAGASLAHASSVSSLVCPCGIQPDHSLQPLPAVPVPAWARRTSRLCRHTPAPAPAPRAVWGQLRDECEHIVWAPGAGVTVSLLESEREPQPCRDKRLRHSRSHAHAGAAAQPAPLLHQDTEWGSGWALMLRDRPSVHSVTCHHGDPSLQLYEFPWVPHPHLGKG